MLGLFSVVQICYMYSFYKHLVALVTYTDPDLSINQTSYIVNESDIQVIVCAELSNAAQVEITYIARHSSETAVQGIIVQAMCFLS